MSASTDTISFYYQAQVDLNNACSPAYSSIYQLKEYPELNGIAEVNQSCEDFVVSISANDNANFTNFVQWYYSENGNDYSATDEGKNIVLTDTAITESWWIAEFANGMSCTMYDTVFVTDCPGPPVDIPNALTVNEDNANETFWIENIEYYPDNELVIYNRWGSVIYRTFGYINEWDGTRNGEPMPIGTYYFILKLNDEDNQEFQGYLTLLLSLIHI